VQGLDCVGGLDHLADAGREGEEWSDVLPGPAPDLADRRVSLAPFGLELLEPQQCHIGVLGAVDRLDGGQDRLAVFQDTKARLLRIRCTMQVCTTVCGNTDVIALVDQETE
jgi:hypothetical protein